MKKKQLNKEKKKCTRMKIKRKVINPMLCSKWSEKNLIVVSSMSKKNKK